MTESEWVPDVPAATVVPLRDLPGAGGLEVLMLRKNSRLAFGGMWVFPGGRVDAEDVLAGEEATTDGPARRAAVREAMEEAALLLDPATLVPFAHWTPPQDAPRRFVTWFYLAPVVGPVDVVIDMGEIHDHGWLSPADAIARRDLGEYELAPPTWMTLRRLGEAGSVAAALAAARATPIPRYTTQVRLDEGVPTCVWEGDAAWDGGDLSSPGPRHRLAMDPAGWRAEIS